MTTIALSPTQANIVGLKEGAILVEAGPGSGKTRVLTERIRKLIQDGDGNFKVLALTFTNKAALEMRERLENTIPNLNDHVWIGTIHSFCLDVLSDRGKSVGIDGGPTIFEAKDDRRRILREAARGEPLLLQAIGRCQSVEDEAKLVNQWLSDISDAKRRLQRPEQVRRIDPVLATAYEAYDAGLRNSHAVDYDDLLLLTHRLFTERPEIPAFYRRLYRYTCIDEAQDLNEAQYRLLSAFCGPDYKNVMMVGDPKQNIYVFTGSHHRYLEQFARDFSAQRIALTENFRSAKRIIQAAAKLVSTGSATDVTNEAATPIEGDVRAFSLPDEAAEADFILAQANRLVNEGHPEIQDKPDWSRIAILARNSYILQPVEDRLKEAGIPHYKRISADDSYQSELLKEAELLLRLLANPRDRLHYDLLLESWGVKSTIGPLLNATGKIALADIFAHPERLPTRANVLWSALSGTGDPDDDFDLAPALDALRTHADTLEEDERASVHEDLAMLAHQWQLFLRSGPGGRRRLISFLTSLAIGTGHQPEEKGLALLTVHSAKGLEFDVVFLMGFAQGIFPDYRANTTTLLEEEQRNAYVAITRAKRLCYITLPRQRTMRWGDTRLQKPSMFLEVMQMTPIVRNR